MWHLTACRISVSLILEMKLFLCTRLLLAGLAHIAFCCYVMSICAYVTFVTRFKFTCKFRCKFTSMFLLQLITFIPSGLESWNFVWHLPTSRPFNVWYRCPWAGQPTLIQRYDKKIISVLIQFKNERQMPHFMIVLIPFINFLNLSWIKKCLFLRNIVPLSKTFTVTVQYL